MFFNRLITQAVVLLAIALFIASCGGSSNVGALSHNQIDDGRTANGVTLGDFEVLRYNADGVPDPAMNNTIELSLEGDSLVVSVEDGGVNGVAIDIKYDNNSVHPGSVEFGGLLGSEDEVLSASFTKNNGFVGIASAPIGGMDLGSFSGEYATIAFPAGAVKAISAVGDIHHGQVAQTFSGTVNLFDGSEPAASTASVSWTSAFHTGDGDQNHETGLSDLTVIALWFAESTTTNWAAAIADYDGSTEVGMPDISSIALFYGEATSGFVVSFADDDDSGKAEYPNNPIAWDSKVAPVGDAVDGVLSSVFDTWTLDINSGTSFSYADLSAFDVNGDGFVKCYISNVVYAGDPPVISQTGAESTILVPVSSEPDETWVNVRIDGYEIKVIDTVGGVPTEQIITGDSASSLVANSDADVSLHSVFGMFNNAPFDDETFPTTGTGEDERIMTETNYDAIFAACEGLLDWQFSDSPGIDIRQTTSWTNHSSGSVGNPGTGRIFPDDDADTSLEGHLVTSLPSGGESEYPWDSIEMHVAVLAPIVYNIDFDVVPDPIVPIMSQFTLQDFELIVENELQATIVFGTEGYPADLATTSMQLLPIQADGWVDTAKDIITLTFTNAALELGQYEVLEGLPGEGQISALINGGSLEGGTDYALRFQVNGVGTGPWSSINKPDEMIGTKDYDAPDVIVVPEVCNTDVDVLQLFPTDPKVRRNGELEFDMITGNPDYTDEEAFFDVLKDESDQKAEWPIEYETGSGLTYPTIVIKTGPGVDPSDITGPGDIDPTLGYQVMSRQGNKLTIDIATLKRPDGALDDNIEYAFKIFNKQGIPLGDGLFECSGMPLTFDDPIPVDWSVNLYDRVLDAGIDDLVGKHTAAGVILRAPEVGTADPPVLWFEFSGGWVFEGITEEQVRVVAQETPGGNTLDLALRLEVAGLVNAEQPAPHYLATHTVLREEFYDPGTLEGLFKKGQFYEFTLYDQQAADPSDPFDGFMTIQGDLPDLS